MSLSFLCPLSATNIPNKAFAYTAYKAYNTTCLSTFDRALHQASKTTCHTGSKVANTLRNAINGMRRFVACHVHASSVLKFLVHGSSRNTFTQTTRESTQTITDAKHALLHEPAYTFCNANTQVLRSITHNEALVGLIKEFAKPRTECVEQTHWIAENIDTTQNTMDLINDLLTVMEHDASR